jgi:ABC-type uncharacterized transport system auxiliary subunit
VGLAGCGGSLFQSHSPPPAVYLLSADLGKGETRPAAGPVAHNLVVLRPRVRPGLDTDRIAALYPDKRLDYFAGARWSGPLDQVLQDLAIQAFRTSGAPVDVSAESSVSAGGYWLDIEVTDFQAEYSAADAAPTINVHLQGRLGAAGDRRLLASFDVRSRQPAAENRLARIVAAYETAVDAALADLAADTARSLESESEQR